MRVAYEIKVCKIKKLVPPRRSVSKINKGLGVTRAY